MVEDIEEVGFISAFNMSNKYKWSFSVTQSNLYYQPSSHRIGETLSPLMPPMPLSIPRVPLRFQGTYRANIWMRRWKSTSGLWSMQVSTEICLFLPLVPSGPVTFPAVSVSCLWQGTLAAAFVLCQECRNLCNTKDPSA